MNSIATWFSVILVSGLAAFSPQESAAEGFTGKDFSKWETSAQDSYIQTSVTMAGMVLTRTKPEASTCIDNWYFAGEQSDRRNGFIRETIASYQDYHPSGVILAILLKECGPAD